MRQLLRASVHGVEAREGDLLLARCCGLTEASVLAHPERQVGADDAARCLALARRRAAGEPFAYLFGEREFYGRRFWVDARVLVPRPETEHLIDACLDQPLARNSRVLDVGTGSGCIAVTLQLERPTWQVVASDCSVSALAVASRNAHELAAPVRFVAADMLTPFSFDGFDLVVSNPPYVDPDAPEMCDEAVREHEPHQALFAEQGGLAFYRRLAQQAPVGGGRALALALEVGAGQADAVRNLFEPQFQFVEMRRDLQGHQRTLVFGSATESNLTQV